MNFFMQCSCDAKCPFFVRINIGSKGKGKAIECEGISDPKKIGWDIRTQQLFESQSELSDYFDIFCGDEYKQCPYYQAMIDIKYK